MIKLSLDAQLLSIAMLVGFSFVFFGLALIFLVSVQFKTLGDQRIMYLWNRRMEVYTLLLNIPSLLYTHPHVAKQQLMLAAHQSPVLFDSKTTDTIQLLYRRPNLTEAILPALIDYMASMGFLNVSGKGNKKLIKKSIALLDSATASAQLAPPTY